MVCLVLVFLYLKVFSNFSWNFFFGFNHSIIFVSLGYNFLILLCSLHDSVLLFLLNCLLWSFCPVVDKHIYHQSFNFYLKPNSSKVCNSNKDFSSNIQIYMSKCYTQFSPGYFPQLQFFSNYSQLPHQIFTYFLSF